MKNLPSALSEQHFEVAEVLIEERPTLLWEIEDANRRLALRGMKYLDCPRMDESVRIRSNLGSHF